MDDEIRAKRLAKLSQSNIKSNPTPTNETQASVSTVEQTKPTKVEKSELEKMEVDEISPQKKPETSKMTLPWIHYTISNIFRITLDQKNSDKNLIFLEELVKELTSENVPLVINNDLVDRIIVARLSIPPSQTSQISDDPTHFDYFLACYNRAKQFENLLTGTKNDTTENRDSIKNAKSLCLSYAGLVIKMPDMFGESQLNLQGPSLFADRLVSELISPDFLLDFVTRFQNEELDLILSQLFVNLSKSIRETNLMGHFEKSFNVLLTLCELKPVVNIITSIGNFNPSGLGPRELEMATFLGPFFRFSAFIDDDKTIADQYFSNPMKRNLAEISSSQSSLRRSLNNIHTSLHKCIKFLLIGSPESKEKTLAFLSEIINKNEKRSQMQVDRMQVSTDGFMINQNIVLLKLSEPFLDPSKMNLVDVHYLLKTPRIDYSKDTKLNATSEDFEKWKKENSSMSVPPPNFVTECFYMTTKSLHLGFIPLIQKYMQFLKELREIQKAQKRLSEAPPSPQNDAMIRRVQIQLEIYVKAKFCFDVILFDTEILNLVARFYNFACDWMMNIVKVNQTGLPLQKPAPFSFKFLPETLIEDISEFFLFLVRANPEVVASIPLDSIVNFSVTFLCESDYIKNPYLRAKFIEILYMLTPEMRDNARVPHVHYIFDSNHLCLRYLARNLMSFYQEVENTGRAHQFYEKFNIRYHISVLIRLLWDNPTHKSNIKEASTETESFVKFVYLLMTDTTFLLDESLSKLTEIKAIQEKMKNRDLWESLPQNERKEAEDNLKTFERQCQSYLFLANETLKMFQYMTAEVPGIFIRPEVVDRLTAMLNYNVLQLTGPKCMDLKVDNPEKYGFNPKELLSTIIDVYIHLISDEFCVSMAKEGRSYKKELFDKSASILRRFGLKSEENLLKLADMIEKIEAIKQQTNEEDMEDAPEEFFDPITCEIMKDPVLLPTSGKIVDRPTIETHLLSDNKDPFNRQPLTVEMLQPATELKLKIQDFITSKKKK